MYHYVKPEISTAQIVTRLRRAADYLEQYGWTCEEFLNNPEERDEPENYWDTQLSEYKYPACAVGALTMSDPEADSLTFRQAYESDYVSVLAHMGTYRVGCTLTHWNDYVAESVEEVTTMFRNMASDVEENRMWWQGFKEDKIDYYVFTD